MFLFKDIASTITFRTDQEGAAMPNILICDDEKDIVSALRIYLSDPDYTLFEAYNGKEALDIVEREEIHLILLDIMMPVMDGMTALARIREVSNAPVILLTAKSEVSEPLVGRQGSRVSMRVAMGSASLLPSHGRGIWPRDVLKEVSRGLSRVEAGNPGFPRLVQVTSGGFSWWL